MTSPIEIEKVMGGDPAHARRPHDSRFERGAAFVNEAYVRLEDASVPILDLGFLQSDAVYDKLIVSKGRYFKFADHYERFSASCQKVRLSNRYTESELKEICDTLLSMTGFTDAAVFWCVTRGLAKKISDRATPDAFSNLFYAYVEPYGSIVTPEQRQGGLDLLISAKYVRIPPESVDPTAKNFHWLDMKMSLFEAHDAGKSWSVMTDHAGYLTEAPGANIFLVKGGKLVTPNRGCLHGITRKTVIELAKSINIPVCAAQIHARDLLAADEAFLTSSAGGVMPVRSVNGLTLGGREGVGEVAVKLHNLYWEKVWGGWNGTPVDYDKAARQHDRGCS